MHEIKRVHSNESKKRVGRGGKRGSYSGRGMKGQGQHGSRAPRPEMRDMIKKIPKKRGYRFHSIQPNAYILNLDKLNTFAKEGMTVTPEVLRKEGVVVFKKGEKPVIKILGTGDITKKVTIKGCLVSSTALAKIEKAGGSLFVTEEKLVEKGGGSVADKKSTQTKTKKEVKK